MSERFIFNKKLNRSHSPWYWVVAIGLSLIAFKSLSQENAPVLVDPEPQDNSVFRSQLQDVQFSRLPSGGAKVLMTFNNGNFQLQLSERSKTLSLVLPKTQLADEQLFKLDVVDFATPINAIETFQDDDQSRVEFALQDAVTFSHQKNSNVLSVEINKRTKDTPVDDPQANFTGEPISLDFQDVPVRQVLQIIAQVNEFNLVTTDTVTGNVTISLSGVPWDQALELILKTKGLDKRKVGNVLLIAPADEIAAREKLELETNKQVAALAPVRLEVVQIAITQLHA